MTKNIASIEEILNPLKGGENNENEVGNKATGGQA